MPPQWNPPNREDFVRRYIAGEPANKLANEFGVSDTTIRNTLQRYGVKTRSRQDAMIVNQAWHPVDPDAIKSSYLSGVSATAIGRQHDIHADAVIKFLQREGIETRSCGEATHLRWTQLTDEEKYSMTWAAHYSRRGKRLSLAHRCNLALSRERTARMTGREKMFYEWLKESGVDPVPQKACGPYNIDFAILPVAVEIEASSRDHTLLSSHRYRYLSDHGWNLAIVWCDTRHHPLSIAAADQVVAFIEECRRNPTVFGQYRVIWGDGEFPPEAGFNLDTDALIAAS